MFKDSYSELCPSWDNVEKYGRARQATDKDVIWCVHLQPQ